uniref:Rhodanese domain-containing protein n=1 Tax=Anopheles quadriannulatus TaxID=34691 RepID=A0A182X3L5_ANOQN
MLPGTSAARCVGSHIRRFSQSGQWPRVMVARTCPQISCSVPKKVFDIRQNALFRMASVNIRGFATTASFSLMAPIVWLFSRCTVVLLLVAMTAAAPNDCGGNRFAPACIEPQLVATTADVDDLPNHPEKLLIDVREPSELAATGQIPTSINIPLKTVRTELSLSPEEFEKKYGRKKPATNDPIIFSCRSGVRSGQASFEADQLGFKNVKNYVGSWTANNNACYSANTMSIATYEEVLDLPNHPEKLLIDVRNPDELADTGKIPTSINIPLDKVKQAFGPETSDEAFAQQYGVPKPGLDHYLILSCRTGRRMPQLEEGLKLDDEAFKAKFGRDKPSTSTEVIFHCKMGGRAQKATDLASSLGFTNARNYKGSWTEWAEKQGK